MDRRAFLGRTTALFAVLGAYGGSVGAVLLRYLFPNVFYEVPSRFKIGRPEDFSPSEPAFLTESRVYVFRDAKNGFSCVNAVCTHLGCNADWVPAQQKFYCACHGSAFDPEGKVLSGPAPSPLEWLEVSQAKDGRLLVDKNRVVPPTQRFTVQS